MSEKIIQCKGYIEECLGESIDSSALEESCGLMRVLVVKDIDIYHKVAQRFGINELIKNGNIHYKIDVPNNQDWNIILSREARLKFEKKYGKDYNIVRQQYFG